MPTLRSRRLESLFGGPIDETLTFKQVMGLIPNAGESPDLEDQQAWQAAGGNDFPGNSTSRSGAPEGDLSPCLGNEVRSTSFWLISWP